MKDEPAPKPAKPAKVPHPPTEAEFKDFARRLVSVPKAVVDRRAAEWAKRKSTKGYSPDAESGQDRPQLVEHQRLYFLAEFRRLVARAPA